MNYFFLYREYPILDPVNDDNPYNIISDYQSPWYFVPTNCLKVNSFQVPKIDSPVVAVVGDNNAAQYMMATYLE